LIDNVVTAGFTLVLQDEEEVFFRVKRTSRLKKLMDAYCHHKSMSANSFVFLFDGSRLSGEQTPQEVLTSKLNTATSDLHGIDPSSNHSSLLFQLEMEEGDTIDAILPQTGG
jgi:hypothetical protein